MSDKPIIMSAPMVRALLEGRKTQTRRVLKPQPPTDHKLVGIYAPHLTAVFNPAGGEHYGNPDEDFSVLLPYRLRQRLWVRETFAPWENHEGLVGIDYRATAKCNQIDRKWRPSIHMPRWASRLTLIVTDVRVHRLNKICLADVYAEGIPEPDEVRMPLTPAAQKILEKEGLYPDCDPFALFESLWDSLHRPGNKSADNPWVCALSFTVHHANIDELREAA